MKNEKLIKIVSAPVAVLFFYAAVSKLMDFDKSRWEMRNQIFPAPVAEVFTWLIPAIELVVMLLILFSQTRKAGLWASVGLLGIFSLYIAVVMTGVFGRVPCSCGGILRNMPYGVHLLFNLLFIRLALYALEVGYDFRIKIRWFHLFKRKEIA